MERSTWTNERLDDLATGMREGFARVDHDVRDLRGEMSGGFADLRGEIAGLRSEMNAGFKELRLVMFWFGGGIIVAMLGAIATSLFSGA